MTPTSHLDTQQLKALKSRAHALKPIVRLGQHGITDAVIAELDSALSHHELVKIKLAAESAEARKEQLQSLCASVAAEPVQSIGHTATLWRAAPPKPEKKRPAKRRKPVAAATSRGSTSSKSNVLRRGTRR